MKDFYIDKTSGENGPTIFGLRLKEQLEKDGLLFNENSNNRVCIISGKIKKGANNILRLDGLYLDAGGKEGKSEILNKRIFKSYRRFDKIVFQSEFSRECYEAFTGIKKENYIINNGAPISFFKESISATRPEGFDKVVIASSKWRRHKRIKECINAFKDKRLKNVALVILGGYKNVDMPNVFCLPRIPHSDLPKYYQMADAMIHLAWLDWCPNTVVEGLASRLPVLCSHNGGTKELVKNDGVVIQLEEDYKIGEEVYLYQPPKVDTNIIVEGILKTLNIPKIQERKDLKISNTSLQYSNLFI
jgi:glycosyltransferase involved in cell wall biosynthesis